MQTQGKPPLLNDYQRLTIKQKQRLCYYCETHSICKPHKDRTQPKGKGCYTKFEDSKWIWCSQWVILDSFKLCVITRSKNESK